MLGPCLYRGVGRVDSKSEGGTRRVRCHKGHERPRSSSISPPAVGIYYQMPSFQAQKGCKICWINHLRSPSATGVDAVEISGVPLSVVRQNEKILVFRSPHKELIVTGDGVVLYI